MNWKLFALLALLGSAVFAEDIQTKRMGWEILFVQPTGSMNYYSGSWGSGLSAFEEDDLGNGTGIQTVVTLMEYSAYSLGGTPQYSHAFTQLRSFGGMVNLTQRMRPGAKRGVFLIAGAGFRNLWGSAAFAKGTEPEGLGGNPVLGEQRFSYSTGVKLAYQVGVGYDFNRQFSATLRCQMSCSLGHTLPTLELSVGKRF